ncbi:MAG TPA: C25 family cysteine peptidase [Anaerolineales bacterium]
MARRALTLLLGLVVLLSSAFAGGSRAQSSAVAVSAASVRLLQSDNNGIVLELATPEYTLLADPSAGQGVQRLSLGGADQVSQPGKPQLPLASALLGVPGDAQVELRILVDDAQPLAGPVVLPLAPHPAPLEEDLQPGKMQPASDPAGLSAAEKLPLPDTLYPDAPARIAGDAWQRDQRILRVELYPFQYNPAQKSLVWHRTLRVELRFVGKRSSLSPADAAGQAGGLNPFEGVLKESLLNYDSARLWRSQAGPVNGAAGANFPASASAPSSTVYYPTQSLGPRYRIVVDHDGLYRVSYEDLVKAGLPPITYDPAALRLSSQGQEVALQVSAASPGKFGPGDWIAFYGQKFRGDRLAARYAGLDAYWPNLGGWQPHLSPTQFEKYTDENVYWLMVSGASGARMATQDGTPDYNAPVPAYYYKTVRREESHVWWTYHFTSEDTWFWELIDTGVMDVTTRTYTATLTDLAAGSLSATVRAEVVAKDYNYSVSPDHHTVFTLNGSSTLDDAWWDGRSRHAFTASVPQSALREGENRLDLTIYKTPALSRERMYFDWFEIQYARRFQAENNQLAFSRDESGQPAWQYQLDGFQPGGVAVYDITDPLNPKQILNPQVSGPQGSQVVFKAPSHPGTAQYLAVGASEVQSPKSLSYYAPPDLFSVANGADYLLITHRAFYDASQALASYRLAQGLRVRVIDVQDLYNEFSDGIYTPLAVKSFLAYAYAYWQKPAPAYVLLVGGGHWNFKGYTGQNPTDYWAKPVYMPPNLVWVDPWQGEVDSASDLANLVGNDPLPDLAIGRLPVDSVEQLNNAINKIKTYEQKDVFRWQKNVLFVADQSPDPAGDFVAISNSLISDVIPASFQVHKVYVNDFSCTVDTAGVRQCQEANNAIINTLNTFGPLFVNYIGHGATERWGGKSILVTNGDPAKSALPLYNDVVSLTNSDRLPVVLSMTCLTGNWSYPSANVPSLDTAMVLAKNGGAAAAFSPTGLGVATGHDALNRGFYNAIFKQGVRELGPATVAAKLALFNTGANYDLLDTYTILGDPALRLQTNQGTLFLPFSIR